MSEENKGAAVALPETHYNGYSDGSEPLYTAEQMGDYAAAFRAEGEADLRARLAAEIKENLAHHRLHDRHGERVIAIEAEVVRLRAQRDEAVAALEKLREAADDSDGACYGTLSTSFVRGIADEALASLKEQTA